MLIYILVISIEGFRTSSNLSITLHFMEVMLHDRLIVIRVFKVWMTSLT